METMEKGGGARESLEVTGARWEKLNELFDNVVRERIKYPHVQLTEAEREKIREQQRAVHELETEILKMFGI